MNTNTYQLTTHARERTHRMAKTLWANGKGQARGVALCQAIQHPADSRMGAFWRRVALHAELLELQHAPLTAEAARASLVLRAALEALPAPVSGPTKLLNPYTGQLIDVPGGMDIIEFASSVLYRK
jgi:hypothetical protein